MKIPLLFVRAVFWMGCAFVIAGFVTVWFDRWNHRKECVEPANAPRSGSVTMTFCQ